MTRLQWDVLADRTYETGVDRGVLYIPDDAGAYNDGVAWNGLTTVTEKPQGAAANAQYADNLKYLNLRSAETFDATLQAFTYPDEFAQFDGLAIPTPGVVVGQQVRKTFGLSFRTIRGSALEGDDYGYKIHLIYGCTASPSEKAYSTVNDTPAPINFSWDIATIPVAVTGLRPTSLITIDSTEVDPTALADLEDILYGTAGVEPALPPPDSVVAMFSGTVSAVTATQPAFNSGTHTITIPTVAGVHYFIDGVQQAAGPVVITHDTVVQARPDAGHFLTPGTDDDWAYHYVP